MLRLVRSFTHHTLGVRYMKISPYDRNLPRVNQSYFVGRYPDEPSVPEVASIAENVDALIARNGKSEFIDEALKLEHHLGTLHGHSLGLDAGFACKSSRSYMYSTYKEVLEMCFKKTVDMTKDSPFQAPSNHSGHVITGPAGVGKSVLLKRCALLSGQLLRKNFVSLYFDASRSPGDVCDHIRPVANLYSTHHNMDILPEDSPFSLVLGRFEEMDLCLGIFIDEAEHLYNRKDSWGDLHNLVTGDTHCALLCGNSEGLLIPMVRGDLHDLRLLSKTVYASSIPRTSLNNTKITSLQIRGLTTPDQYIDYLESHPQALETAFPDLVGRKLTEAPSIQLRLRRLHAVVGGPLHLLSISANLSTHRYLNLSTSGLQEKHRHVLRAFVNVFHAHREKTLGLPNQFDVFDLPLITEKDMMRIVENDHDLISELIRMKLIIDVDCSYVLSHPLVYLWLMGWSPRVFISHDHTDIASLADSLNSSSVERDAAPVCSSSVSDLIAVTSTSAGRVWEKDQVHMSSRVIVVISPEYMDKSQNDANSSCYREWDAIVQRFEKTRTQQHHKNTDVIFCYVGSFDDIVSALSKYPTMQQYIGAPHNLLSIRQLIPIAVRVVPDVDETITENIVPSRTA